MPQPKSAKTSDNFTPEEQKQFDSMREADKPSQPTEAKPDTSPADTKPSEPANTDTKDAKPSRENSMVPHAALEEERLRAKSERDRRKELEKRLEQQSIEQAKLEERVRIINEAMEANQKKAQPATPQKLEVPDPEKDALGALKAVTHNTRLTEEENRILKEAIERRQSEEKAQQEKQRQAQTENLRIQSELSQAAAEEADFAGRTPDFKEASDHLRAIRRQQLQLMGFTDQPEYDPQTLQLVRPSIDQMIGQDLLQMARTAKMRNQNAGEFVYNMAKTVGYQPKSASTTTSSSSQSQPSAAEQLDKLSAAQRANRSLGDISGNAPPSGKITGKDLATMSDTQFAKLVSQMSPQEQMEYFGN